MTPPKCQFLKLFGYKPGNIMIEDSHIRGLIDWEITKFYFAEEDFAQMEYLVWEQYPETKTAFLDGYRSIRKLPDFVSFMPLLRVDKALGAIGFTIARKTWKGLHKFVFEKNMEYLRRCEKKNVAK
jgi:hypothetical protein